MAAIVVNLFGGPGSRKSTMATSIFSELKWNNVNCEYASEYAKDKTWEKSFNVLSNQIHIFGEQHHRIWRLLESTDVIITDSPLLLSLVYDKSKCEEFKNLVVKEFSKNHNLNYYLVRQAKYNPAGRSQTLDEAREKDKEIFGMLNALDMGYKLLNGEKSSVEIIVNDIMKELREKGITP